MQRTGFSKGKRILLIDREQKNLNDRTWCFWESGPGPFESIVYHRWPKAWFRSSSYESLLDLAPYNYKMIRGIDFYEYAKGILETDSAFSFIQAELKNVGGNAGAAYVDDQSGKRYEAKQVFSSILFEKPVLRPGEHYLLQHFRGWIIETASGTFDPAIATLMDFRVAQDHGCTFAYVLPFTEKRALVEYTLFTAARLNTDEYDAGLRNYTEQWLQRSDYKILDTEDGVIPMTSHRFKSESSAVIMIGTAGGQTKASSGVRQLEHDLLIKEPANTSPKRFHFYDKVMLDVLAENRLPGDLLFSKLFEKNTTPAVLAFLDNETSFSQELSIISSLPIAPFLKAALAQV